MKTISLTIFTRIRDFSGLEWFIALALVLRRPNSQDIRALKTTVGPGRMKHLPCFVLIVVVTCVPAVVRAQAAEKAPRIELYTMGQGDLLVEKFGHAALCVRYADFPDRDVCYNYGTTDFSAPVALGWSFLRGRAQFWSSTVAPAHMISHYREKDRSIWLQQISLSPQRAEAVARKLHYDAQPEHRYYRYHHFRDNCSTRVRDIIDSATDGVLRTTEVLPADITYRTISRQGFAEQAWLLLASDVFLTRKSDAALDGWAAMFLPDYLRRFVHEKLGAFPVQLYERKGRSFAQVPFPTKPIWLIISLTIWVPLLFAWRKRNWFRPALTLAVFPSVLIGVAIWALALITSLPEVRYNEALLVFIPLDIAVVLLRGNLRIRYAQVRLVMILLVSCLLALGIFRQPLMLPSLIAFFPLLVAATIRDRESTA